MTRTNTILLLENDAAIAKEIIVCLSNFGYAISHHDNKPSDLITVILREKPDLILMEVREGEELKQIETAEMLHYNYQIPVVFLTTLESRMSIEKLNYSALHNFIFKPLVEKELVSTVELTLFRYSMERKLQESEKKYSELSNSISQAIIECDLDGKILSLNRHGMEMFGVSTTDIDRGILLTDYVLSNTSGSILEVSKQSCFIDSGNINREFVLINKFNKKYTIDELLTPVYSDYKHSGYRGIFIDITNKKLKQNLCVTFNNVNSLFDRADASITEISDYIVGEMKEIISDLDILYFENFEVVKSANIPDENNSPQFFEGYTKFVAASNKPLLLRGKEFETFNRKEGFTNQVNLNACWMGFPIVSKTNVYGVFVLSSQLNKNALSIKNFEKLIDFFESINLFLEKVSYLKELKRSENLFRSLVNTINEGLVKIDLDSTVTFVNNRLNELSGYEHEDVVGKKCKKFLQPQDFKGLAEIIENRKNGISSQYEMNIKIKSGKFKKFYINGAPYRDENGEIIGTLGTFTDISVKQEQLALFTATETLLREIASKIDVAFWIYSFEGKSIQYLSPAFKSIFEVELDEIYKLNSLRKFIHPEDVRTVLERSTTNLSSGECILKYRIITPGGQIKWICDKSIIVKDSLGKAIKVIGYAQEITKLKLLEEKLIKGETEKENIIRSIPDSFIVLTKEEEIINSYFKITEKEFLTNKPAHLKGKNITEVFDERVTKIIRENVLKSHDSPKTVVFELDLHLNEIINWYEIRMTTMSEKRTLMIIRNITSSKNSINNIQKLFNITEQTQELILITDSNGKVEYVNPMFTGVTGYEFHEIMGQTPDFLKSGRHSKSFYRNLWNTLKSGQSFKADFYNKNKSGGLFIEEKIITPYLDINGEITNFISTGRDVTQERQEALKASKHIHLERTLAIKRQRNRTMSITQGHENERRKFAKEIHEGLNQMLSVAKMNLETISDNELINGEQKGKIEFVNKIIGEIMKELSGLSTNLSPAGLFQFGLHAVIGQMIKRLNTKIKTIDINFKSNIEDLRFPEEVEINFYRIIQEALQNGLNHSEASKINVALNFNEGRLIFLIKDNGVGINKRDLAVKKKKLFGLSTLEQRAALIGAVIEITTNKNKGFEINIAVKTKTMNL